MHLRFSTKRQNGRTYRYAQLVQSCRVAGKSTQRVLANLGDLPERTLDNLRLALCASRDGQRLVMAADELATLRGFEVCANRRYLDVAVLLQLWRELGLDETLRALLPAAVEAAPGEDVVAALVVQRGVAPGSKHFAQRWLPTTALPELLDLLIERFNNTRLHRVLDELHAITPQLQQHLTQLYRRPAANAPATAAFFVDVTDTWFEGRGCELAERHRTKAGHHNKWSVGIVLVADDHGYPFAWRVVSSKTKDHLAMAEVIAQVKQEPWARDVPFVFDRAMGRDGSVHGLLDSKLQFLTAVPVNSIESYTTALPHALLAAVELEGTEDGRNRDYQLVAQAARETALTEVDDNLFVLDLGTRLLAPAAEEPRPVKWPPRRRGLQTSLLARLRLARQLQAKLDAGEYPSRSALAQGLGLTRTRVNHLLGLLRLAPDVQNQLLSCPAGAEVTEYQVREALQETDVNRQRALVADLLRGWAARPSVATDEPAATPEEARDEPDVLVSSEPHQVRLAAYFNPQMRVDQFRRAQERLAEIYDFVTELNDDLAHACQPRKEATTRRRLLQKLERYDYAELFDLELAPLMVRTRTGHEVRSFRCQLTLKPEQWEIRNRYNGFVLLVAHPRLAGDAEHLVRLYRAKDAVEKDFQTIKSAVKLRPIYHHTDPKVLAHVTLCMLALLLHRALESALKSAHLELSAPACLELLATCHLNEVRRHADGPAIYAVTRPTQAQTEILAALKLGYLVEDAAVAQALTPRFVPT